MSDANGESLPHAAPRAVVIGVGNPLRGDDGVGLEVARLVDDQGLEGVEVHRVRGEATQLVSLFSRASRVRVVDAIRTGAAAGTLHRIDVHQQPLPVGASDTSTHGAGLAQAVELARALGSLPAELIVHGVEADRFEPGTSPAQAVATSGAALAAELVAELRGPQEAR